MSWLREIEANEILLYDVMMASIISQTEKFCMLFESLRCSIYIYKTQLDVLFSYFLFSSRFGTNIVVVFLRNVLWDPCDHTVGPAEVEYTWN